MARTREPRHQHQMSHIDMSTKKTKGAEEYDVRKSAQPRKTAQLIKIVAVAVAVAVVVSAMGSLFYFYHFTFYLLI